MSYTPTLELRWLEVTKTYLVDNDHGTIHIGEQGKIITERQVTFRTLQQKWEDFPDHDYQSMQPNPIEWRDVPTVKEVK